MRKVITRSLILIVLVLTTAYVTNVPVVDNVYNTVDNAYNKIPNVIVDTGKFYKSINLLFISTAVLLVIVFLIFIAIKLLLLRIRMSNMGDALVSAIMDIMIQVENASAGGWRGRMKLLADTHARFSIDGVSKIEDAKNMIASLSNYDNTAHLNKVGEDISSKQDAARGGFLYNRGQVRSAVAVLLLLLEHNVVEEAFYRLVEYMAQQKENKQKGGPNFTALKRFFEIPEEWPSGDLPDKLRMSGLSKFKIFIINRVIKNNQIKIANVLVIRPPVPDGKEPIYIRGDKVFIALRMFMHNSIEDLYRDDFKS